MRFPNAHEGVKKIFTAEILMIIVTIGTVIVSGISMSGNRSEGAIGAAAIILVAAGVISIIAFIMNLLGIIQARKDEQQFTYALYAVIGGIVASLVQSAFPNNGLVVDAANTVSSICSARATYSVIGGIQNLAEQLGNADMIAKGKRARIIVVTLWLIVVILQLLGTIFGTGNDTLMLIESVLLVAAGVLSIILYFVYLSYLSKSRTMLGQ
ncbi:MAG: hypothetical protein IKF96_01320 [Eggerthellaceae bacterium]|nr:hypothetical protein [Eggerthellaceae bacterium]